MHKIQTDSQWRGLRTQLVHGWNSGTDHDDDFDGIDVEVQTRVSTRRHPGHERTWRDERRID